MIDGRIEPDGAGNSADMVVFHTRAYTMLMEAARAAMPGEVAGLLFGSAQRAVIGQSWVTVKEVIPVDFTDTGGSLRRNSLQISQEQVTRRDPGLQVVGWFYADPGTGVFAPRVPIPATQMRLPSGANLFLLVNPAADQGAFYIWNGQKYLPTGGFYEAVPDEGSAPIIGWNGEIRGVTAWLGPLLAELEEASSTKQLNENSVGTSGDSPTTPNMGADEPYFPEADTQYNLEPDDWEQTTQTNLGGEEDTVVVARVENGGPLPTADELNPDYSASFFVEVITEEPVEYLPPEMTPPTAELPAFSMPEIAALIGYADADAITDGDDTRPQPILPDAPDHDSTMPHRVILPHLLQSDDTMPQPILLEPSNGDSTMPHPILVEPLDEYEADDEPAVKPSPTFMDATEFQQRFAAANTGPLGALTGPLGATTGPLGALTGPLGAFTGPLGALTGPLGPMPDIVEYHLEVEGAPSEVHSIVFTEEPEGGWSQLSEPAIIEAEHITGPLSLEQIEIGEAQASPDVLSNDLAAAEFDTFDTTEAQPEQPISVAIPTATSRILTTGTLLPPARSIIRPVVRQRKWLEALLAIAGAVGIAIVGLFLVADMLAKQNGISPNGATTNPSPLSTVTIVPRTSEAVARDQIDIPTETPTPAPTLTPISTITSIVEPAQIPTVESSPPPLSP